MRCTLFRQIIIIELNEWTYNLWYNKLKIVFLALTPFCLVSDDIQAYFEKEYPMLIYYVLNRNVYWHGEIVYVTVSIRCTLVMEIQHCSYYIVYRSVQNDDNRM